MPLYTLYGTTKNSITHILNPFHLSSAVYTIDIVRKINIRFAQILSAGNMTEIYRHTCLYTSSLISGGSISSLAFSERGKFIVEDGNLGSNTVRTEKRAKSPFECLQEQR